MHTEHTHLYINVHTYLYSYCKCRKPEPVCFLHNRKLKAKCVKEKAQNKREYLCMSAFTYLYVCMHVFLLLMTTATRLCQTADVSKAKSANRHRLGLSVCGTCPLLPTSVFNICFIILHYFILFFSSFFLLCSCFYSLASCTTLLHMYSKM